MPLSWEELELTVLRWVLQEGMEGTTQLRHDSNAPFADLPHLPERQVAEALNGLAEQGLVTGNSAFTAGSQLWSRLRPSADGLRVLGEWPPADAAKLNVAIALILRGIANSEHVPESDRGPALRAAGTVASVAGEVVFDVVQEEMERLSRGAT